MSTAKPTPETPASAMKTTWRYARNFVLGTLVLAAVTIGFINVRAKPLPTPPEYDAELQVPTMNGGTVRLGDLVDAGDTDRLLILGRFNVEKNPDVARQVLYAVPADDPRRPDAMRFLGWHLHSEAGDDPTQGVAFVNEALRADPTNGNAWQDLARCYLRNLGL